MHACIQIHKYQMARALQFGREFIEIFIDFSYFTNGTRSLQLLILFVNHVVLLSFEHLPQSKILLVPIVPWQFKYS